MLRQNDLDAINDHKVVEAIARSLDPLAFKNKDKADLRRRRAAVYTLIELAYTDYRRREFGYDYNSPDIQDADIPW